MRTQPVVPARIDFEHDGAPYAPDFGDVYHAREGALAQARHVFVGGNGLPERWRGRERFALLEAGFGLGHNFLAAWDAWRADARRSARLHFVSIDKHPPSAADLARAHVGSALPELAQALLAQWPPLTPNLHRLAFEDGRVELLLLFADVADAVRELVGRFDAFLLDGFAPARNADMWQPRLLRALARLAAPGATAATWSVARELRDGLAAAGFAVERAPGFRAKREMTVARFAPRHLPAAPPGRPAPVAARDVAVVGAGLGGCAAAHALVEAGFHVTLLDAGDPRASSQRGALFHGVVHRDDGPHARFTRAAALHARHAVGAALAQGVPGAAHGFLRIASAHTTAQPLHAVADAQRLPADYLRALDAAEAAALAGVPVAAPAWLYTGGGWVDPHALCAAWSAGIPVRAQRVAALHHDGTRWQLLDADGHVVLAASQVVVAAGARLDALLGDVVVRCSVVRGQTTWLPAHTDGLRAPSLPLADAGYVLTLADGSVLCGASAQRDDRDLQPRDADRRDNLARLQRLTGSRVELPPTLDGDRTGLRLVAPDRLPLVGAWPDTPGPSARRDAPRFVPRRPGLHVLGALGSRGATWGALCGRLLAAQLAGAPWPLEASLADAVDPARFVVRTART